MLTEDQFLEDQVVLSQRSTGHITKRNQKLSTMNSKDTMPTEDQFLEDQVVSSQRSTGHIMASQRLEDQVDLSQRSTGPKKQD